MGEEEAMVLDARRDELSRVVRDRSLFESESTAQPCLALLVLLVLVQAFR